VAAAVVVLAIAAATTGCANDPRGENAARVIDKAFSTDTPGCSAAVAVEDRIVWTHQMGLSDLDSTAPLDADTRFNIGSVSKQFTATAILMLQEAGDLDLDDTVADHFSELPDWAAAITVRDLMHHTSGIVDPSIPWSTLEDPDALVAALQNVEVRTDVELEWYYANANYVLLAGIVENVTGDPLDQWLQQNVFEPNGDSLRLEVGASVDGPTGYTGDAVTYRPEEPAPARGASDVWGTPSALALSGSHYRDPVVLSAGALDLALSDGVPVETSNDLYGPGIISLESGGLIHAGSAQGMATLFAVSPDRSTTVAISCNILSEASAEVTVDVVTAWLGDDFLGETP